MVVKKKAVAKKATCKKCAKKASSAKSKKITSSNLKKVSGGIYENWWDWAQSLIDKGIFK